MSLKFNSTCFSEFEILNSYFVVIGVSRVISHKSYSARNQKKILAIEYHDSKSVRRRIHLIGNVSSITLVLVTVAQKSKMVLSRMTITVTLRKGVHNFGGT